MRESGDKVNNYSASTAVLIGGNGLRPYHGRYINDGNGDMIGAIVTMRKKKIGTISTEGVTKLTMKDAGNRSK